MPNLVSVTKPALSVATTALHAVEQSAQPLLHTVEQAITAHHYPQDFKRAALFGLATMATKLPGSFYRRFVDDGTAPDVIKQIDNKRELILQSLCFAIGMSMDYVVNPKIAAKLPQLFKNPMCKAFMMVPCLFIAEGASRLLAGQKKDLYKNAFANAGNTDSNPAYPDDFKTQARPTNGNAPMFAARATVTANPFAGRTGNQSAFKAFVA
jgi:hypothetical protein